MTTRPTWQTVTRSNEGGLTERLAVPGGWLYRVTGPVERIGGNVAASVAPSVAVTFVPVAGADADWDAAYNGPEAG